TGKMRAGSQRRSFPRPSTLDPHQVWLPNQGVGADRNQMAEADIAYVATAGAAGLALALSAWAARVRARLARRAAEAEARLAAVADQGQALQAAITGFGDVRVALDHAGVATAVF